jgi:hypothetical protein
VRRRLRVLAATMQPERERRSLPTETADGMGRYP